MGQLQSEFGLSDKWASILGRDPRQSEQISLMIAHDITVETHLLNNVFIITDDERLARNMASSLLSKNEVVSNPSMETLYLLKTLPNSSRFNLHAAKLSFFFPSYYIKELWLKSIEGICLPITVGRYSSNFQRPFPPSLTKHIASEQRNENNGLREEDILWSSSRHRRSWSVIARWIKISIISFFINTHEHGLLAHSTIETAAAGGDLMAAKDEQMRWRCSPRTSNYLLSLLVIVLMSSVAGFLLL